MVNQTNFLILFHNKLFTTTTIFVTKKNYINHKSRSESLTKALDPSDRHSTISKNKAYTFFGSFK